MNRKQNDQAGFSLLEAAVAVAIVLLALTSIMPYLARSMQAFEVARRREESALRLWNEAQRFRAGVTVEGSTPDPEHPRLRRLVLRDEDFGLEWEVIHGQ